MKPPKKPKKKAPVGMRAFRVLKGDLPEKVPVVEPPSIAAPSPFFQMSPLLQALVQMQTALQERRTWRDVMFANLMSDGVMLVTTPEEITRLRNRAWRLAGEFSDFMATNNAAERLKEEETLKPIRERLAKEFGPVNT